MAKKSLEPLTESMFYVLLALRRSSMCGTEITSYISDLTDQRVAIGPATLYTILGKFLEEDLIREIEVSGRKRTYEITAKGNDCYQREVKRMTSCLKDAEKGAAHGTATDPLSA